MSETRNVSDVTVSVENEMLTNEVRRLRAQVKDAERKAERAQRKLEKAGGSNKKASPPKLTAAEARVRELEASALDDMHWLVNRLDRSPVGPFVRRRGGFKNLKEKYGPDPRAEGQA